MRNRPILIIIALLLMSVPKLSSAQQTFINLDTTTILLGDQINLKLGIELPTGAKVTFPLFADTLTKEIEIIKTHPTDTVLKNGTVTFSQLLTITAFDSGYFVIPPIPITYYLPNDTATYFAETEAMLLESKKVQINEQEDIKELKDIFNAPLTFREILPYILALIGLIILLYLAYVYWRKYHKKETVSFIRKPAIPPHTEALTALDILKNKKLWENGFVKEYYTELTDILRNYLQHAFGVNAPELTTDETFDALASTPVPEAESTKLKNILVLSDLVKFAKYIPVLNDHESCFNGCRSFVVNTSTHITIKQEDSIEQVIITPISNKAEQNEEENLNNKTEN